MDNLFWVALSLVKGIGNKTLNNLYKEYPYLTMELVVNDSILKKIPNKYHKFIEQELLEQALIKGRNLINTHKEKNIEVIPINDSRYPKSLRKIQDPPAILYAKGNIELLQNLNMVAIVGTREPTEIGILSGKKIASTFAEMGYIIVSGLALGIDTAGHKGALRVDGGKTIAVLAGNLTEIYPAENKALVEEIIERDGLLVSETPIGSQSFKGNFVKRDRIQSGLSLGVCPVQTPIKSGTQHTIAFAKEQNRILFSPTILEEERNQNAVQGNIELLKDKNVIELKNKDSYQTIIDRLETVKNEIIEYNNRFESIPIPSIEEKEYKQESFLL